MVSKRKRERAGTEGAQKPNKRTPSRVARLVQSVRDEKGLSRQL